MEHGAPAKILPVDDMKNNDPSQFPNLFSLPVLIQLLVLLKQFFETILYVPF